MECKKCTHYRVCLAYSGADELECCELVNEESKCDFYEEQAKKTGDKQRGAESRYWNRGKLCIYCQNCKKKSVMYAFSKNVKHSRDDMGGNVFNLYDLQGNLTAAILENDVETIGIENMRRWKQ